MSSKFITMFIVVVLGALTLDVCFGARECPVNSEPLLCGSICESTCKDPRERACKIDPTKCTTDCRCLKGFVRNQETNGCVKFDDCTGATNSSTGGDGNLE